MFRRRRFKARRFKRRLHSSRRYRRSARQWRSRRFRRQRRGLRIIGSTGGNTRQITINPSMQTYVVPSSTNSTVYSFHFVPEPAIQAIATSPYLKWSQYRINRVSVSGIPVITSVDNGQNAYNMNTRQQFNTIGVWRGDNIRQLPSSGANPNALFNAAKSLGHLFHSNLRRFRFHFKPNVLRSNTYDGNISTEEFDLPYAGWLNSDNANPYVYGFEYFMPAQSSAQSMQLNITMSISFRGPVTPDYEPVGPY